jgi:hypothetical protein
MIIIRLEWKMPGRKFEKYASEGYRFGFTGHERNLIWWKGKFFGWKI